MKEVKITSIKIEAKDFYPVEIEGREDSVMLKQNDDWILWPKSAIPELISALQQLNTPNP